MSELLRKADALIPEVDESEKNPPPAAVEPAAATPERIDPRQEDVSVRSNVPMSANARTTSASTSVSRPASARAASAPKSSMDTMRADAEREFLPLLRALPARRDKFEADYRNYQSNCSGPVSFVQPVPSGGMSLDAIIAQGDDALIPSGRIPPTRQTGNSPTIDNARTPLCRSLLQDIRLQRLKIRSDVNSMRETARRRGFWPGIMRDIFGTYGLTY